MTHPYDLLEPGLALSGKPRDATVLDRLPFGGILNVSDSDPPRYARGLRADIQLVRRPINDVYPVPLPYLTLAVLELAEMRRQGVATLVHCQAGRSRSPTVVALYWMARDGIGWKAALARVQGLRHEVEPNPFFATEPGRARIIEAVRSLLSHGIGVLEAARARRETLIRTFRERTPDLAEPGEGWNSVEAGLSVGTASALRHEAMTRGDHAVVQVEGTGPGGSLETGPGTGGMFPGMDGATLSDAWLARLEEALREVAAHRAAGRAVCILSPGDESAGLFTATAFLMLTRGWDVATALWFVGSRRATLWTQVGTLWSTDWERLRETLPPLALA